MNHLTKEIMIHHFVSNSIQSLSLSCPMSEDIRSVSKYDKLFIIISRSNFKYQNIKKNHLSLKNR